MIRLELASSWQYPRGSAGRSYLIRLPLAEDGAIDPEALKAQPARATVRRYWPNEADMVGQLVSTPQGYAIQYETNASVRINGGGGTNGRSNQRLFQFDAEAIEVGEEIFLTEPDGHAVRYRIANVQ